MKNLWGKPVIGWKPNSDGIGGIHNPMGYAFVRGVVTKRIDGEMKPIYDQPMLAENACAIIIAQAGDRIALVKNFRMNGDRILPDANTEYIKRLQDENRWSELCESLGAWKWEAPRGLIPPKDGVEEDEASYILRTAKQEAYEEAGLELQNTRIVGNVNLNSTFFAHPHFVVHAEIADMEERAPEKYEIMGNTRLCTLREIRELCDTGECDDGFTLAALALCGLTLPQ